jgi:hypothetical protein
MDAIQKMETKIKKRDNKRVGIKMPVHNLRFQELVRNSIANNQKKNAPARQGHRHAPAIFHH